MNKLLNILLTITLLASLCACRDDSDPSSQITLFDIVKFESQNDNGSTFTLQKPNSQEVITLTAPGQFIDTKLVPVSNRLLLVYVPKSGIAYQSGEVTLKGYQLVTNLKMVEDQPLPDWDRDPIYLMSIWRSGPYLNARMKLPATDEARYFSLVRDPKSPDPTCPDLYLCHKLKEPVNTYDRTFYVSYDISDLLDDPQVKGFTIHLNDCNLNLKTIDFKLPQ